MNYKQFSNLSCYEEFEIQCDLRGISKTDVLEIRGEQIDNYYFFISNDGIFNWFDLEGNHIENPGILKTIKEKYIPKTITKCIIPNGVTRISSLAFFCCDSLKEINIPDSVSSIGEKTFFYCDSLKEVIFKGKTLEEVKRMEYYPFGIKDESIIKCEI